MIFVIIFMIPAFIFRKKISFLFTPDSIIGYHAKHRIFVLFNIFPAIIIAGLIVSSLRDVISRSDKYKSYENYSLFIGFVAFFYILYFFGIITDRFLYLSNKRYKDWKDKINYRQQAVKHNC
jgi:hypothetical protein